MVLNRIVITSYIVYILYYTIIDVNWGIGVVNCILRELAQLISMLWVVCINNLFIG